LYRNSHLSPAPSDHPRIRGKETEASVSSNDELLQKLIGLTESFLSALQRIFIRSILDFDTDRSTILNLSKCGKKLVPLDVTESGKFRYMPAEAQNPSIVQTICESFVILGMYVNDSVLEFIERSNVVDLLPNQMRGVKVETKVSARD